MRRNSLISRVGDHKSRSVSPTKLREFDPLVSKSTDLDKGEIQFTPKLKQTDPHCRSEDHQVQVTDPYQRFSLSNVLGLRERQKYIDSVEAQLKYLANQYVHENCPVKPGGVTFYLKPINYQRLSCEEIDKLLGVKHGIQYSTTTDTIINVPHGKTLDELRNELREEEEAALDAHVRSLVKCRHCKQGGISKRVSRCRRGTRLICRIFTLNWAITDAYFLASQKRTFFVGIMVFTLLTNLGQRFEAHPFYTKEFWASLGTWLQSIFYLFFVIIVVLITKMFELLIFYMFTTTEQRLRRRRFQYLEEKATEIDHQYISVADDYHSDVEDEDEEPDPTSSDPDIKYMNRTLNLRKKLYHHRVTFSGGKPKKQPKRRCCRFWCC